VCSRTGLDDVERGKFLTLPGLELRSLGPPTGSQSLYRLSYRGSHIRIFVFLDSRRIKYSEVNPEFLSAISSEQDGMV
jgi:hypothetical protein